MNVPELVHEGHSVVGPSGCIRIMDESGIQLKNLREMYVRKCLSHSHCWDEKKERKPNS